MSAAPEQQMMARGEPEGSSRWRLSSFHRSEKAVVNLGMLHEMLRRSKSSSRIILADTASLWVKCRVEFFASLIRNSFKSFRYGVAVSSTVRTFSRVTDLPH